MKSEEFDCKNKLGRREGKATKENTHLSRIGIHYTLNIFMEAQTMLALPYKTLN